MGKLVSGNTASMRVCGAVLAAVLAAPAASTGQQTCSDRDLLYHLDGNDLVWGDIKAVSTNGALLVVLTGSFPVVHLFDLADGSRRGSWGKSGEGPGEFLEPTGVALVGRQLYVLDAGRRRLTILDSTGGLVRTVNLQDAGMPPYYPTRPAE